MKAGSKKESVDLRKTLSLSCFWVWGGGGGDNTSFLHWYLLNQQCVLWTYPCPRCWGRGGKKMQWQKKKKKFPILWNLHSNGDNKPKKCKGPESGVRLFLGESQKAPVAVVTWAWGRGRKRHRRPGHIPFATPRLIHRGHINRPCVCPLASTWVWLVVN